MTRSVPSTRRTRAGVGWRLALAVAGLGAGCGGGSSDGPSKKDYQASINTFCTDVKAAAGKVVDGRREAAGQRHEEPDSRRSRGFGTTLETFADSTQTALDRLRKAGVPKDYESFNGKAVTAFDGVIAKLHAAATGAKQGNLTALSSLGTDLGSVKLPDLPKDISKNAKACADISG